MTIRRVTFHHVFDLPNPVHDLVEEYKDDKEVRVEWQPWIRKSRIATHTTNGWRFEEERLQDTLDEIEQFITYDPDNPHLSTIMLDIEPIDKDRAGRAVMIQRALSLTTEVLNQRIQAGVYALPSHKGLANGAPPDRFFDAEIIRQGATFIVCNFKNPGSRWFEKGIVQTKALIERVRRFGIDRPDVAYIWPRTWARTGRQLISDRQLTEQITLLLDAGFEISVAGNVFPHEVAHVMELTRNLMLA